MKYSAAWSWQYIVLTQHPDYPVVHEERLSAFLEEEVPEGTEIVRVPAPFSQKSTIPEAKTKQHSSLLWGLRIMIEGLRRGRQWEYDLVYAVAPVFVNAFAGAAISFLNRKPLVLDLKDDWVGSPQFQQKASWKQAIEKHLESLIITRACKVLLVTLNSYHLYKQRYPSMRDKFVFVPNGCDLQEYMMLRGRQKPGSGKNFTILTAAGRYEKDYRDAQPFFEGLARFFKRCPEARQNSEVVFLGENLSHEYDDLIVELDLDRSVIREPAVHREKLVERLWESDLLFLVQPVGNATAISGTLYEYWAVGRAPILLIAENGASSDLINQNHLGESFRHDDIEGIASYLETVYRSHQAGRPLYISSDGVEAFDRKNLAELITEIFQDCSS